MNARRLFKLFGSMITVRAGHWPVTVPPEESARLIARQLEESKKMERDRTRCDFEGSAERRARARGELKAERGIENLPRRDGSIVEPLHHHRHPQPRGRASSFVPAPKAFTADGQ